MHTRLVILAGGASSRMKKPSKSDLLTTEELSQANTRDKGLISVGPDNRPLMDYLMYNAKKAGYTKIYIIINAQGQGFKDCYGADDNFHGLEVSFPIQYIPDGRTKPFGTADALLQAVNQFPELKTAPFTVCNCDNLYSVNVLQKLRETEALNAFISYDRDALDFSADRIARFAVAKVDEEDYLLDIIEKPSVDAVGQFRDHNGSIRVSMNIFKFDGAMVYPFLENCPIHPERKEKEIPSVLLNLIKNHPKCILGIPVAEHVPDLTAKDDILKMKTYLSKHYVHLDWND